LSGCSPRSLKVIPDPVTKSVTVRDTKTSPGCARAWTLAAMWTPIPATSSPRRLAYRISGASTPGSLRAQIRQHPGAPAIDDVRAEVVRALGIVVTRVPTRRAETRRYCPLTRR
jgi:hypothetical protein